MEELLTIQDCVRIYKVSTNTIRKWIKKNLLPASFSNNQYFIRKEDIESLLSEKGLLRGNTGITTETTTVLPRITTETTTGLPQDTTVGLPRVTTDTTTGLPQDTTIIELKKENEYLKERIADLEHTIATLEQDKQFLQAQVQQLTNTLSLLTTRQLPEPKRFVDKIKDWFKRA
ncbi:MAG: helix-turn-helix domain-containing protein [bacterium]|nr:helix-turn-helix domain-containing protein [bacterium]